MSLGTPFTFTGQFVPGMIICRRGGAALLGEEAARLGAERVLLICGTHVRNTPFAGRVIASLGARLAGVFDGVRPHTPIESLSSAVAKAREVRPDAIVSLGGGSAHDTAKGAALLYAEGVDDIFAYRLRFSPPDQLEAPVVRSAVPALMAVPTTLSAADVVGGGAFTDPATGIKAIVVAPQLTPKVVILDAQAAATTPVQTWLSTGMNALDHCVEALYSRGHQPFSDALALYAAGLLVEYLPRAARDPDGRDLDAREAALVAASLSGLTYGNSGLGINHAICHCLGGRYGVAHGVANTIMLPHGMRFNLPVAAGALAQLARVTGGPVDESPEAGARRWIAHVEAMLETFGLPRRLRDVGVPRDGLGLLADDTMTDPQVYFNPRPVARDDVVQILHEAW